MVDSIPVNRSGILIKEHSPTKTKILKSQLTRLTHSDVNFSTISSTTNSAIDAEINKQLLSIGSEELAEKLEGLENTNVIFDLRSASSYCRLHISNATLLSCTSKLKVRRAIQIVNDVLKSSPNLNEIILYTDHGYSIKKDDHSNTLFTFLINNKINCLYLKGGIKTFEAIFPQFCKSGSNTNLCLQIPKHLPDINDIYFTEASQILSFLYIGNEFDATNEAFLQKHQITHVLNLTVNVNLCENGRLKYMKINCNDNHLQDLRQILPEAFQFIESARISNGRVLVHCQAGISRSASVVIAYLMSHVIGIKSFNDAWQWVKKYRSIISPNFNFMGQLLQFENDLLNGVQDKYDKLMITSTNEVVPVESVPITSPVNHQDNNSNSHHNQQKCANDKLTTE